MTVTEGLCQKLGQLLEESAPKDLLCIGAEAPQLLAECGGQQPSQTLALEQAGDALSSRAARADLALVTMLSTIPRQAAGELLARLRDQQARRVLVVSLAPADHWSHTDLLGYGFTRAHREPCEGQVLALYEFSIATYKTTPDWLNPRNWANPQHWDKYRW